MGNQPDVLVFCVDEVRADPVACAGNSELGTPYLARLAATGTSRAWRGC